MTAVAATRAAPSFAGRIEESELKHVRMAHLAVVGSHWVNGVAAMDSELVKHALVPDFHALWPATIREYASDIWRITAR
jgi:starch phosphorylase